MFKSFDFLGCMFGFTYDESVRLETSFGGVLSSIFFLLTIIIVSTMGSSFFDRSTPTIKQQITKFSSSPKIEFGNKFSIAVRMTFGNETLYQNLDRVRVKLVYNHIYKSNYNNVSLREIPMTICSEDKFPFIKNYFQQHNLNESLCPDLNGENIMGDFLSDEMNFIQFKFHMCENDVITGKSNDGYDIVCQNVT